MAYYGNPANKSTNEEEIRRQMAANSQAWHSAPSGDVNTQGTKEWLHAQNEMLAAQLGNLSFDSNTGMWNETTPVQNNANAIQQTQQITQQVTQQPTQQQTTTPTYSTPTVQVPTLKAPTSQVTDYSDYLKEMYKQQEEAAVAQLKKAYDQNVNAIDRAGEGIDDQYRYARNQTAGDAEVAARNFAEYANAYGLNSGAGGQAELARNVTLQNNMNSLNMQQAQTVADLQLQRANAETEYNNAIAQAQAEGNAQLAAALYQEKIRVQEALLQLELQQQAYDLQMYQLEYQAQQDAIANQQYADSLAQAERDTLASYGAAYLEQGIMPSADMLAAMGITQSDAQAYINSVTGGSISGVSAANDYESQILAQMAANSASWHTADDATKKLLEAENQKLAAQLGNMSFDSNTGTWSRGATSAPIVTPSVTPSVTPTATQSYTPSVGYDNGGLDTWQIKQLQAALGVNQDGYYGPATQVAAGGISAGDLWNILNRSGNEMLSESAWNYYKEYGNKVGYTPAAVTNYNSYNEYAQDYLQWALSQ